MLAMILFVMYYQLIINEATHISGLLIYHVYISKSLLQHMVLENVIVSNMSFSDHDVCCQAQNLEKIRFS